MTTEQRTILVDMDNVIAWFDRGVLNAWNRKYPDRPTRRRTHFYIAEDYPEYRKELEEIYNENGFFLTLPTVPGAISALEEISKNGHNVVICTSPLSSNPTCEDDKLSWIEDHLGAGFALNMLIMSDKTKARGHMLIDDKPDPNRGGKSKSSWEHVVFAWPYNGRDRTLAVWGKRRVTWANWEKKLPELGMLLD